MGEALVGIGETKGAVQEEMDKTKQQQKKIASKQKT